MLNLWVSLPCLAQEINPDPESAVSEDASTSTEPEQALSTQFDLVENSAIDSKIHDLLKNHVSVLNRPADKITSSELRLLRFSVRREIANILATEGYFSPLINFDVQIKKSEKILVHIKVELGPVTKVTTAQVNFVGDAVPPELQQSIQSNWGLQKGATFRDDDWSHAKTKALESLTEHSYAAAKITDSQATIQDQQADLSVLLDSGPVFRIGELRIQGLNLYKPWLLDRYHPPVTGDVYSRESLLKFQRTLQNSPYFSSVSVSVDPDPEVAAAVPVEVLVKERQEHDVGLGAGYSTNTGARGEVSYRDRDFVGDAYDLRSVLRIEQLRQIGYADIYLPPRLSGYLDSFGVLFDRSDISGLLTATSSFGAKRVITEDSVERRLGLSFVYEQSTVSGDEETHAKALVSSIGWTWRAVNNVFEPRQGQITQLDISGATKHLISDQNFLRLYGKYQRWIPVATRDVIILRIEAGYVLAADSVGIPEDYLFRAGGTASVRGYSYQSLGVNQADGVVGGRVLTTATAEYVHWLEANWGVAGFVDVGDAADHVSDLSLKQGIGMGLRYKTPAGPIALDLAYGRQTEKLRLDFSIGIAF
ncbi:autotransporter assembly complex protein TamA [Solimicrobium silvestre]|nr:autotransporter assembly complex family protein [Solimicrobium silvestre]